MVHGSCSYFWEAGASLLTATSRLVAVILCLVSFSASGYAPGGLDENGCHANRLTKTGNNNFNNTSCAQHRSVHRREEPLISPSTTSHCAPIAGPITRYGKLQTLMAKSTWDRPSVIRESAAI